MVLSAYFLHESDPEDHQQIILYSFCRSMLALHLAVKYYFKSFCVRFEARYCHTSVSCISLQNASRTALCYATNTIK